VRSSGVQEFRSSGVQEFRSSGVQEFRSSGVQEFRSSGVQEFRVGSLDTLDQETYAVTIKSFSRQKSPTIWIILRTESTRAGS
jgi:hypothetical protein